VIERAVAFTARLRAWVAEVPAKSITATVNEYDPEAVGTPLIWPPGDRVSPGGSRPDDNDQKYGATPPVAVNVWLYAAPTVPGGRLAGEMVTPVAILIA
jgi:hypothetical protein